MILQIQIEINTYQNKDTGIHTTNPLSTADTVIFPESCQTISLPHIFYSNYQITRNSSMHNFLCNIIMQLPFWKIYPYSYYPTHLSVPITSVLHFIIL